MTALQAIDRRRRCRQSYGARSGAERRRVGVSGRAGGGGGGQRVPVHRSRRRPSGSPGVAAGAEGAGARRQGAEAGTGARLEGGEGRRHLQPLHALVHLVFAVEREARVRKKSDGIRGREGRKGGASLESDTFAGGTTA